MLDACAGGRVEHVVAAGDRNQQAARHHRPGPERDIRARGAEPVLLTHAISASSPPRPEDEPYLRALTRMLLGFGLRHFSMHPANILTVKQRILSSNMQELEPLAAKMLKLDAPEKMLAQLEKLNA